MLLRLVNPYAGVPIGRLAHQGPGRPRSVPVEAKVCESVGNRCRDVVDEHRGYGLIPGDVGEALFDRH
jgi:hypothetical protein